MVPGLVINSFTGKDGKIHVPFLGAVVGTFSNWQLTRSEETTAAGPRWTLRGVLSYQNDTMLKSDLIEKHFTLILNSKSKIEICGFDEMKVEGASILVEGVVQCQ